MTDTEAAPTSTNLLHVAKASLNHTETDASTTKKIIHSSSRSYSHHESQCNRRPDHPKQHQWNLVYMSSYRLVFVDLRLRVFPWPCQAWTWGLWSFELIYVLHTQRHVPWWSPRVHEGKLVVVLGFLQRGDRRAEKSNFWHRSLEVGSCPYGLILFLQERIQKWCQSK